MKLIRKTRQGYDRKLIILGFIKIKYKSKNFAGSKETHKKDETSKIKTWRVNISNKLVSNTIHFCKDILKHNDELSKLGIIYRRQDHPNQQLYVCGDLQNNIQTHFIHVVIFNSKEWNDYINMRDYLNANEEKANEYSNLKIKFANEYPNDRIAYTQAKSKLIEEILKSAALWRKTTLNLSIENQLNETG